MKKTVLCLALAALSAGSVLNAATQLTGGVSVSLDGILANEDNAAAKNVMAYSAGSLFVAGNFDTAFGGITPLTTNDAFIIKYGRGMTEAWKVQLMGAATVTAMLVDGNGGVYVAGVYADEVIVGSTDGNTKTITGYQMKDDISGELVPSEYKAASFIAHYDGNGVLLGVNDIIPAHDPALDETGMYYPSDNDGGTLFAITELFEINGGIYAVGTLKGQITSDDATETATSGSYNLGMGGFYFDASKAGVIIKFDDDLSVASFPVIAASKSFEASSTSENVVSMTAAVSGSKLYIGLNTMGTIDIKVNDKTETISHDAVNENYGYNFGYSVLAIDTNSDQLQLKDFGIVETEDEFTFTSIDEMEVVGDKLIVTGMFQTALGFDKSIVPTSSSDMYVAAINTSDLNTAWAVATGYNEGDAGKYDEAIAGSAILSDVAYIYGYSEQKSDLAKQASLFYSVDLSNGTIENMNPEDYIFGMVGDDSSIATAHTTVPVSGITFTAYGDFVAGVDNIAADNAQQVNVYPNPVADVLYFSLPCDVQVYSLDGKQVLDVAGATSVDVSGLNSGVYVVKTVTAGETSFCKVLKK